MDVLDNCRLNINQPQNKVTTLISLSASIIALFLGYGIYGADSNYTMLYEGKTPVEQC